MNTSPIQIRKPEVVSAIRGLARRTGRPITQVVADAVKAEERRLEAAETSDYQRRLQAIREVVAQLHQLPKVGPPLTDDDLYDEDGLPR